MVAASLTLIPDEELIPLLSHKYRRLQPIHYLLTRRASIKDIIESLNIPHTEVAAIICNGEEIPFYHIPVAGGSYRIHAFSEGVDMTRPTLLRPPLPSKPAFLVDINVARLAPLLRMAGFDTFFDPELDDTGKIDLVLREDRILLSRNRDLLQRKELHWGRLIRSQDPEGQLREVISLYGLKNSTSPFSRCMQCNAMLEKVDKADVLHLLEPLTRKYYSIFHRCTGCKRIYWRGSHHGRMAELIKDVCVGS